MVAMMLIMNSKKPSGISPNGSIRVPSSATYDPINLKATKQLMLRMNGMIAKRYDFFIVLRI